MSEWKPIAEAPKQISTRVLGYSDGWGTDIFYFNGDEWVLFNEPLKVCRPTHWMPLPQPPKETNQSQNVNRLERKEK